MHIHLITPFRRSRVGLLSLLAVLAASVAWGAWHAQRVPRLVAHLNHPDLRVRADAARRLGELRDERAVPPLIHRMRNDCVEVAAAAMEALGAIGGPEATAALIEEARGPKGLSGNAQKALLNLGLDRQGPPTNPVLLAALGHAYWKQHELAKAADCCVALSRLPELPLQVLRELSNQVLTQYDCETGHRPDGPWVTIGSEIWQNVTKTQPQCAEAWLQLAYACSGARSPELNPEEVERCFREVLKLYPRYADDEQAAAAHCGLGRLYLGQKQWAKALAEHQEAAALRPESIQPVMGRAETYLGWGEFAKARDCVEALLRRRIPFYPSPYEEMAYIFLRANQLAAIIQHYRQVVERTPQDVAAWRFLGCAYGVQRQRKLAISAWQQVVALAPDDAEAYYQLGEATQQLGRREQARQALGKALGIDPRHMGAQQALARLDQEL